MVESAQRKIEENDADEINLSDYIKIVRKRKNIIIFIFFVSVITTVIVSFLTPKTYKATAAIMITPSKIQAAFSPSQISLDLSKTVNPAELSGRTSTISFSTHKVLLKSNIILERIIERLNLTDEHGRPLIPDNIMEKLNIKEAKEETSIFQLAAEDSNPKKAQELANEWAKEYVKFSQELISGEVKGTGDFISEQFEIARNNLTEAEKEVKIFKEKNNLDLMKADINIRKKALNLYKEELLDLRLLLKSKENLLIELKEEIAKQDKFIIVSKAITDDALWQRAAKEKNMDGLDKRKLRSEEINPLYQDLESRIVNTSIEINTFKPKVKNLEASIKLTESEIEDSGKVINQMEFELIPLNRSVEMHKSTYEYLSAKTEEARLVKSLQLGEVKLISPAREPRYPIKPNKKLNIAVSGSASLIFGLFLVFFMEYLKRTKPAQ